MKLTKKKKAVSKKRKKAVYATKVTAVQQKYTFEFEEAIKYLRDFFSYNRFDCPGTEYHQRRLWNVLTALRGPDGGDNRASQEKEATTKVIRTAVFGEDSMVRRYSMVAPDSKEKVEYRLTREFSSYHFKKHAEDAFEALDLKWNRQN